MDLTNIIIHGIVSREFSTPSSPNVPVPSQIPSGSGLLPSLCFAFNFGLLTSFSPTLSHTSAKSPARSKYWHSYKTPSRNPFIIRTYQHPSDLRETEDL